MFPSSGSTTLTNQASGNGFFCGRKKCVSNAEPVFIRDGVSGKLIMIRWRICLLKKKDAACTKTKPTPDWKGGAARPPQAGRSESVALESGLTI